MWQTRQALRPPSPNTQGRERGQPAGNRRRTRRFLSFCLGHQQSLLVCFFHSDSPCGHFKRVDDLLEKLPFSGKGRILHIHDVPRRANFLHSKRCACRQRNRIGKRFRYGIPPVRVYGTEPSIPFYGGLSRQFAMPTGQKTLQHKTMPLARAMIPAVHRQTICCGIGSPQNLICRDDAVPLNSSGLLPCGRKRSCRCTPSSYP